MITYNDIYEALRKERYSEQLQPMTKKFLKDVSEYFQDKKNSSIEDNPLSESVMKNKKQFENAITMFKELMLRRKKKILNLVFIAAETGLTKRDSENMLQFEKTLFESLITSMEISDRELTQSMKNEEIIETKKNSIILFKERVEEFLDLEGNKTGPFNAGEIASLSSDIAKILVSSGKAENMEGENNNSLE